MVFANEESRGSWTIVGIETTKMREVSGQGREKALTARARRRHTVVHDSHLAVNRLGGLSVSLALGSLRERRSPQESFVAENVGCASHDIDVRRGLPPAL